MLTRRRQILLIISAVALVCVFWSSVPTFLVLFLNNLHVAAQKSLHHIQQHQEEASASVRLQDSIEMRGEVVVARSDSSGGEEESQVESRLRARRERLQAVCRKYSPAAYLDTTIQYRDYFFHHHNTTVCLIAKAGSSTWREHLRRVNEGPPQNVSLDQDETRKQLLALPIDQVIGNINASKKIITVRHPLTRLVSCYRQKYEDGRKLLPYYPDKERDRLEKRSGCKWVEIVHKFWVPALQSNHLLPPYLHRRLSLQKPFDPSIMYKAEVYVRLREVLLPRLTFTQFLMHVVTTFRTSRADAHWSDYNRECSPCYFDYQYVTKVETMEEDLEFIFKTLGIPADAAPVKNRVAVSEHDDKNDYNYYRKVPRELKREVYNIFKMDFEMYDYKLPDDF